MKAILRAEEDRGGGGVREDTRGKKRLAEEAVDGPGDTLERQGMCPVVAVKEGAHVAAILAKVATGGREEEIQSNRCV
jgi:hypothetical protein